jgi:hypothetical protein
MLDRKIGFEQAKRCPISRLFLGLHKTISIRSSADRQLSNPKTCETAAKRCGRDDESEST